MSDPAEIIPIEVDFVVDVVLVDAAEAEPSVRGWTVKDLSPLGAGVGFGGPMLIPVQVIRLESQPFFAVQSRQIEALGSSMQSCAQKLDPHLIVSPKQLAHSRLI
jgi:hypothetical protein